MSELSFRNATARDIVSYYGTPLPCSLQAVVVLLDGEPRGIVGLVPIGEHLYFFSEQKPELLPFMRRMPVLRAIQRVMSWIRRAPRTVLAVADNPELLGRLGFVHAEDEVFVWPR